MANIVTLIAIVLMTIMIAQSNLQQTDSKLELDNADGLIAYTCDVTSPEFKTIDLTHVEQCVKGNSRVQNVVRQFQLVQTNEKLPVHVKHCKIQITRLVTHCGMHSHSSMVDSGLGEYVFDIGQEACNRVHETRMLRINNKISIYNLIHNSTVSRSVTLAGSLDKSGSCEGESYSDPFGTWSHVVVQATIQITLVDYLATVDMNNDYLHLKSGLVCKYSRGYCMDTIMGDTVWNYASLHECSDDMYTVLYSGQGELIQHPNEEGDSLGTYFVETHDRTFALKAIRTIKLCKGNALQTEHPRLYIVPRAEFGYLFDNKAVAPESLDLLIYMNAKFVYLDRSTQRNFETLYNEITYHSCLTERKTMKTQLTLAYIDPPQFAYNLVDEPGVTAVLAGQVAHIIKCIPVIVKMRKTTRCYQELPITYMNTSVFLQARSRIIQKIGTEVECNPTMPNLFFLQRNWWGVSSSVHPGREPVVLDPNRKSSWKYHHSESIATSGIYDDEELKTLQNRMLFHNERTAIESNIARSSYGKSIDMQGISIAHAINEEGLNNLSKKVGERIWSYFSVFGNISAGCFGIYIVFKVMKFIFDTALHGQSLYTVYGWSYQLIASVWDSMTTCLLHRAAMKEHVVRSSKPESDPCIKVEEGHNPVEFHNATQPQLDYSMRTFTQTSASIYPKI